jgi:hypothetical protein
MNHVHDISKSSTLTNLVIVERSGENCGKLLFFQRQRNPQAGLGKNRCLPHAADYPDFPD